MNDQMLDLAIDAIIEPRTLLRLVDRDSMEYLEMRDSLRDNGFLNSISARPARDSPGKYEIIDGLYRFTCSKELGLRSIPCIVKYNVDDDKYLALQLQAQAIRPETKPIEFAQQIRKLLMRRPEMTFAELGHTLRKSPGWIKNQLGLLSLGREVQQMIDRGEMPVRSAYMLAKLPRNLRSEYIDKARGLPVGEFHALAAGVIKSFTEAVKLGKMEVFWTSEFKPTAHQRKLKTVLHEISHRQAGPLLLVAEECKTPMDGFYAALRWTCHLDRQSVTEQEVAARGRSIQARHRELEPSLDD